MNLFDLDDHASATRIEEYGYPNSDQPHAMLNAPLAKVRGKAAKTFLVHSCGPYEDFVRRCRLVAESEAGGVWINWYRYPSDEKLSAVRDVWWEAQSRSSGYEGTTR